MPRRPAGAARGHAACADRRADPPSLAGGGLCLLAGLGLAVVRRVEPGALVSRRERLQDTRDALPGRRAADQGVISHALFELETRAVLATVDVHGHGQRPSRRGYRFLIVKRLTAGVTSRLQEKVEPGSPEANLNVALRADCVTCARRSDVAGGLTSGVGVIIGVG